MKKCKLKDLIEVTRGASLAGEFYSTEGELVRLTLGNFDYENGGFKINTSKDDIYFTGEVKDEFILNEGDIITPLTEQAIGLLGTTAKIPESGKYIQSQDVALVKCNEEIDPAYCYYLLPSNIVKKQLSAGAQQTSIRHTSPDKIKDCWVYILEKEDQKKVASFLDIIENKISINREMNVTLDKMAKQLYDYWFVQFDFPNKEGNPYKTSGGKMVYNEYLKREIPEGWRVLQAGEICNIKTGKEDANFATPDGKYPFFTCSRSTSFCDTPAFDAKAILLAGNGDLNVKHYTGKFNAYQRTYVIEPKDSLYWGALYQSTLNFLDVLKRRSNGAIIKFITIGDVNGLTVFEQPDKQIYERLNRIFDQIEHNELEILRLTALKNHLSPLLLNGQIKIN